MGEFTFAAGRGLRQLREKDSPSEGLRGIGHYTVFSFPARKMEWKGGSDPVAEHNVNALSMIVKPAKCSFPLATPYIKWSTKNEIPVIFHQAYFKCYFITELRKKKRLQKLPFNT